MEISAPQLAELLLGIARAQAAIIQGLENEMAGVRSGRIMPALQNVAHLRDHPQPTLTDLPVRVLLGTLGRQVPERYSRVLNERGVFRELYRSDQPVFISPDTEGAFWMPRVAIAVRAGDEVLALVTSDAEEQLRQALTGG